jgi:hypothetical protein
MILEDAILTAFNNETITGSASSGVLGILIGMVLAFLVVILFITLAFYIYTSLAFMAIGKKIGYSIPGIAWIPVVGKALIASNGAKMHWWPVLLLLGIPIPFIGGLFLIAFLVFFMIWMWKTFEALGKPGWWVLLWLIPAVNFILYLVFIGIAAWGETQSTTTQTKSKK